MWTRPRGSAPWILIRSFSSAKRFSAFTLWIPPCAVHFLFRHWREGNKWDEADYRDGEETRNGWPFLFMYARRKVHRLDCVGALNHKLAYTCMYIYCLNSSNINLRNDEHLGIQSQSFTPQIPIRMVLKIHTPQGLLVLVPLLLPVTCCHVQNLFFFQLSMTSLH